MMLSGVGVVDDEEDAVVVGFEAKGDDDDRGGGKLAVVAIATKVGVVLVGFRPDCEDWDWAGA